MLPLLSWDVCAQAHSTGGRLGRSRQDRGRGCRWTPRPDSPLPLYLQNVGVHSHPLPDLPHSTLDLAELERMVTRGLGSPCHTVCELVCLENTHSSSGGRVLPINYLRQVGPDLPLCPTTSQLPASCAPPLSPPGIHSALIHTGVPNSHQNCCRRDTCGLRLIQRKLFAPSTHTSHKRAETSQGAEPQRSASWRPGLTSSVPVLSPTAHWHGNSSTNAPDPALACETGLRTSPSRSCGAAQTR